MSTFTNKETFREVVRGLQISSASLLPSLDNGGYSILQLESRISGTSVLAGCEGIYGHTLADGFIRVFVCFHLEGRE